MRNKIFIFTALFALLTVPVFGVQLLVDSTNKGNFNELDVVGGVNSDIAGKRATLNLHEINQVSTTAAIPVLILDQDDVDQPILGFQCTEGGTTTNTCSHYSTSTAAKSGTIKIDVNGSTRYINFYNDPD